MAGKKEKAFKLRLALAGNPNCGKTTLFNRLTGSHQHTGNWTGVTVDRKEGRYKKDQSISIIDLPGIYSLSPYSVEEVIARNFLLENKPDAVINIIEAANLNRNLYLTNQLMMLDVPVVLAVNMIDEAEKQGVIIDKEKLEAQYNCKVFLISATKKRGIDEMMEYFQNEFQPTKKRCANLRPDIEAALREIEGLAGNDLPVENKRWTLVKLFEKDELVLKSLQLKNAEAIFKIIDRFQKNEGTTTDSVVASEIYRHIDATPLTSEVDPNKQPQKKPSKWMPKSWQGISVSERVDRVLTHRIFGLPIFALIMFVIFLISVTFLGNLTIDLMEGLFEWMGEGLAGLMEGAGVASWFISLLCDGIIAGVGAVLTFVPQIMILFGLLSILEATGYMARVAFMLDRLMRSIGLSGKSVISIVTGYGCSVPAIMSTRTIKSQVQRENTIALVPFVPCSAKLPIFAFFTGGVIFNSAFAATSMYFVGLAAVIVGGLILKTFRRKKQEAPDTFVFELPPYRLPAPKNVLRNMWDKGKHFIIKAGTVIFIMSIILWVLQTFNYRFDMVDVEDSLLASIGKGLRYIFIPLGFGQWQATVATLSGFAAKEAIISTMEIIGFTAESFTAASAYSFMLFSLLCTPCIAAVAAIFREVGGAKKGFAIIGFQFVFAYVTAMIVYQCANAASKSPAVFWTVFGCVLLAIAAALVIRYLIRRKKRGGGCGCGCEGCSAEGCAFKEDCDQN